MSRRADDVVPLQTELLQVLKSDSEAAMGDAVDAKAGTFDELVFKRELNEVYLLLDFISGRSDAHIWNLDLDIPQLGDPNQKQTAFSLYRLISTMRYPPPTQEPKEDKAYNATVLMYVKDKLNSIAAPARSMTIAYTYIYLAEQPVRKDEESRKGHEFPKGQEFRKDQGSPAVDATSTEQTKASVARSAFPNLIPSAQRLRTKRNVISIVGLVVFLIAAYLLCWTVYGSVIIKRFEEDRLSALDLEKSVYMQLIADKASGVRSDVNGSVAHICCWDTVGSLSPTIQGLCGNWSYYQARYNKAIADAGAYTDESWLLRWLLPTSDVGQEPRQNNLACPEPDKSASKGMPGASTGTGGGAQQSLMRKAAMSSFVSPSTSAAATSAATAASAASAASTAGAASASNAAASSAARFRQEDVQSVALIVSIYSTYVLPLFFGFIGTVASFLRDTGNKALASTLAPRDESLAEVRLLLGAIAGIAVGLFYNPASSAQQVTAGLGVLTLSASAVAFIAGYAADVFFNFLDSLSGRLFNFGAGGGNTK